MKWLTELLLLSAAMAVGTWLGAWWMVPLIGALYGVVAANRRLTVVTSMLAGTLGWAMLLGYDASVGPLGRLLQTMGALFRVPGGALVVLTLAYSALLAATAAATTRGLRRAIAPQ